MGRIIFKRANLIDGINSARPGSSLIVEGERITAVSAGQDIPANDSDQVIDLAGKTIMPGMCIGHFHVEYDGLGRMPWVNLGAERPPGVVMAYAIKNARIALHAGYTSAVGTACVYDIDINLVMAMEEKVCEGPRLVPCSPHVVATGAHFPATPWWLDARNLGLEQGQCTGPDEFRKFIRQQIARGVRMIKLLPSGGHGFPHTRGRRNISLDEIQASVNAAHERGAWIRAHVNYPDQILECIEAGVDIIDHADELDDRCIEAMAKHGTCYVPTIGMTIQTIRWDESKPWLDFMQYYPRDEQYIVRMSEVLRKVQSAGIPMLIGDDYGPKYGFSSDLWGRELNMFVDEIGMSPLDVIRMATANGAPYFDNQTGVIAAGKLADLLVLDFDPLKDGLRRLAVPEESLLMVMKGGEVVRSQLPTGKQGALAA